MNQVNDSKSIIFSKPDFDDLKKQGFMCVDMHFHSNHSDGAATPLQYLEKIRALGIGISITDHNEISGSVEAFENKNDKDLLIPGIEVKSEELVDVLFYFYDLKELKRFYDAEILRNRKKVLYSTKTGLSLSKILSLEKDYECVVSVPHPFGYSMRTTIKDTFERHEHLLEKCGIFEAINGGNTRNQNLKAVEYLTSLRKGFTAGTDGHSIYPLGNIVTCSKATTVKEFLDNIKNKKNIVVGVENKFGKIGEYGRFGINKMKNLLSK